MNLVTVNLDSIRIGSPLPFALRNREGVLLAQKGFVPESRDYLHAVLGRGSDFFIDVNESDSAHRAYMGKLYDLVREDKPLGKIAGAQIVSTDLAALRDESDDTPDWLDLQIQANTALRETNPQHFVQRLERLTRKLNRYAVRNPDGTLFALIHLSATEIRLYSATHAMTVMVMCGLAAREVLNWPEHEVTALGNAALTMNLGMTDLQDRMAQQDEPPNPSQRRQIDEHADRSAHMLWQLGITDPLWLEAVREHHTKAPGPLAARTDGNRLARLIQRADMFSARLAPRGKRVPTAPATAMQACYFDEERKIDEAGAALIKAVGIYSPGSFVKLASNEIAIVIRRGANTTTPRVAILVNRSGMPTGELIVRDTSQRDYRITASVPHREVKVKFNLERLLALTATAPSDRYG
jgi:HD-GYP domain-containing protein (c-di-GMP phosphodiesterase class II)